MSNIICASESLVCYVQGFAAFSEPEYSYYKHYELYYISSPTITSFEHYCLVFILAEGNLGGLQSE